MIRRLLLLAAVLAAGSANAASLSYCTRPGRHDAQQQDHLLRLAGIVRDLLAASPGGSAVVARSGQDLQRFGQRYSHAGVSLRASSNVPWSVRQLYFDCDDRVPRLYDQGIAGFVLGMDDPRSVWVSIVFLPAAQADALERAALDDRGALALLARDYSANAHAFATAYQNCNQWVAELLATAWGGAGTRAAAQGWLADAGYVPAQFDWGTPLLLLARPFVPWLHDDDHPAADIAAHRYRVSMPAAIEAFVHATVPDAGRVELCLRGGHVVLRRGWTPLPDGCVPGPDDSVLPLDDAAPTSLRAPARSASALPAPAARRFPS